MRYTFAKYFYLLYGETTFYVGFIMCIVYVYKVDIFRIFESYRYWNTEVSFAEVDYTKIFMYLKELSALRFSVMVVHP